MEFDAVAAAESRVCAAQYCALDRLVPPAILRR